ncbi:MAG TPA: carboxypeptidase regulatory-like domain-containing protein [Candidatus Acidoferrales bacterium]|nr:carboxypeptidase regulatory-like domain-containing protein [Candidatus Acidoferrales bacterium]
MKRIFQVLFLTVLSAAFLFSARSSWAQATTSLRGVVTDPSNAAVPNATVRLTNTDTNTQRTTTTDQQGSYVFAEVVPGHYTLDVTANGFSTYEQKGFELLVNLPATINVHLKVGAATATVTVTEQAPLLNTTDASQGNTMSGSEIGSLPLEARNVTQLLTLQPGVVFTSDRPDFDSMQDTRSGAVNGARSDQNNLTLDGVDVNDQGNGFAFQTVLPVTVESVQEFRVTTSNYGADQGRSGGAEVALVTRGGTNQFHGSLYEFNRSSLGEANDFFVKNAEAATGQPNKPLELVRNIFGGSIGGPIKHDRLFFFLNYEGHRQAEGASASRSIPSPQLANGIIQYQCAKLLDANGDPTIANPACVNPPSVTGADGTTFTPASGNFALGPAQLAAMDPLGIGPSPSSLAYFKSYYANPSVVPNDPTTGDGLNFVGFRWGPVVHTRADILIGRIDYKLTADGNHSIFARGSGQDVYAPGEPLLPGGVPQTVDSDFSKGFVVGYTAVLHPNLVNNFRYGYTRQSVVNAGDSTLPFNGVRHLDQDINYGVGFSFPVHNITDDLAWTRGNHSFTFGTNIGLIYNNSASTTSSFSSGSTNAAWLNTVGMANKADQFNPACIAQFGAANPGCDAADTFPAVKNSFKNGYDFPLIGLLGMVTEVNAQYNVRVDQSGVGTAQAQGAAVRRNFGLHEFELYAQDSWKIRPNLTFNYGLRMESLTAPWETKGQQVAPTFDLGNWFAERNAGQMAGVPQNQFPNITFDIAGRSNHRSDWWPTSHDFAPRVSLAWSPNPNADWLKKILGDANQSSIRAGFGMFYDHYGQGLIGTFDTSGGEFGLATNLSNPAGVENVASAPRWQPIAGQPLQSAVNNIPGIDGSPLFDPKGNPVFTPAPATNFPVTFPSGNFCICWGIDGSVKTPYSYALDFSIQRQLPKNMSIEVAYIGRLGHRLMVQSDLAQPLNLRDPASGITYYQAASAMAKVARTAAVNGPLDPANITTPAAQSALASAIGPTVAYWQNQMMPLASGDQYNPNDSNFGFGCGGPTSDVVTAVYAAYFCNSFNETTALQDIDVFGIPGTSTDANGNPNNFYFANTGPFTWFDNQYSSLFAWRTQGWSHYNAMEVTFKKQMSQGLQFDVNYTYGTSFDIASDAERVGEWGGLGGEVVNPWMGNQLSGPSDFDLRHQINANWVWDLPFGEGRPFASHVGKALDAVIGGWQLSGITRWSSQFPVSGATCFCFSTNWQLTGVATVLTPTQGGHNNVLDNSGNVVYNLFKDPASAFNNFDVPLPGESGSRNQIRGDGFMSTDMEFGKVWKMPFNEQHTLRLTVDMFNVFNTKRFNVQNASFSLDTFETFGDYTHLLTNPRIMQVGLRYAF